MNSIALNQTVLNKNLVVGQGFKGGDKKTANKTPSGYYVWINGVHDMPAHDEVIDYHLLAKVEHPSLLFGMGDCSGELRYWLGETDNEYVLFAGVNLSETRDDPNAFAIDVASMTFKDRVPINQSEHAKNLYQIAGNLLLAHFAHFLGLDGGEEFKGYIDKETNSYLLSVVDHFINNKEDEVNITLSDNDSKEVNDIADEMNKMFNEEE